MNTRSLKRLALPAALLLSLAAVAPSAHALGFAEAAGSPYLGSDTSESAVADFDGDGNVDIVTGHASDPLSSDPVTGEVVVRLGDGRGGFATSAAVALDASPQGVSVGDLDGDGAPDVVTSSSDSATVLLGDGDGGLTRAWSSGFLARWPNVTIADVAGSPAADLLVSDYFSSAPGRVAVLVGAGDGTFTAGGSIAVNQNPSRAAVADLDGDGVEDVVTTGTSDSSYHSVAVQLGDGAGGWSEAPGSPYVTGNTPSRPYVADLNSDGDLDIAYSNVFGASIGILLGDGDGRFAPVPGPPVATVPWPVRLAIADFDDDGSLDIVTMNNIGYEIAVHLGDGTGNFSMAPGGPFATAHTGFKPLPADVDGDSLPDLVVTGYHEVSVLLNRVTTPDPHELPSREQPGEEQPGREQPGREQPGEEQPGRDQPGEQEPPVDRPPLPQVPGDPDPIGRPGPDRPGPIGQPGDALPPRPVARAGAATSSPRIVSTALRARRGATVVRVSCPTGTQRCAGAVRLRATSRTGALLGSGRLTAGSGRSAAVTVTLNRLGRRALAQRRSGALPVRIVVTTTARPLATASGSLR